MAQLKLIVTLETTPEYDEAVLLNRRLRIKTDAQTPADQLRQQVRKVLRGLRYIETGSLDVEVMVVVSGHHSQRSDSDADSIPSLINDLPSERKEGMG